MTTLFSFTNFCWDIFHFLCSYEFISFYSFFRSFWLIPSLLSFFRVYWVSSEFIEFLPSLLSFYRIYWVSTNFSKYFPSFLFLVDFIPIFIVIYWLLLTLQNFLTFLIFCRLLPSFTAVNRKFLFPDFRLLSTSVKIEIFTDFYRSQKKIKHPRCLQIIAEIFATLT